MAKKNVVHLIGYVNEIVNDKIFTLKIRKNANKFVYPIIEIENNVEEVTSQIQVGKIVCVEGRIKTAQKETIIPCPNCNNPIYNKYIFTTVLAEKVLFMTPDIEESYMNRVILLGAVCKDKEFKYIKGTTSPVGNTKYQIAVNRTMRNETDYPWITTFARQAEEDMKRLVTSSQILVDGSINTRINIKDCECENCKNTIQIKEAHTEVLGSTIEYLDKCLFEENNKKE